MAAESVADQCFLAFELVRKRRPRDEIRVDDLLRMTSGRSDCDSHAMRGLGGPGDGRKSR